jgi:hypothetical protein
MTDKEYLGLHRGDAIYALGYGSPDGPDIEAYVFESRSTGGRIFARKPSLLNAGEDAIFRLHASTTYLNPQEAARAHVAEKRNAIAYHEGRLEEAKRNFEAALRWAKERGFD